MSKAETPPVDALVALFFLAWRGFAAEADAILEQQGLGRVHHRILFVLARLPDTRVGALAETLGVTRQGLHRPLKQLRDLDLVEARAPKASGRERALRLTRKGAALEQRATGVQRAQLSAIIRQQGTEVSQGWIRFMHELARSSLADSPQSVSVAWKQAMGEGDEER